MENNIDIFISEGMKRFKEASKIATTFRKELVKKLQDILATYENWKNFEPDNQNHLSSSEYGIEYPLVNSRIQGKIFNKDFRIQIEINWYLSENEYPFYAIWFYKPKNKYSKEMEKFLWKPEFQYQSGQLRFFPDEQKFDLETDFRKLIDEFVRFLDTIEEMNE